ncbi:MAG: ParA family protein [Arenicellales bacterium]|nr:ParA family protein [Arenicellales bacterium]
MGAKQILVINSKGGVGKSTLTSNLASYFSFKGRTALCDFDRQMSGVRWLERRDPSRRKIDSITGWEYRSGDDYDWMIMDTPAGITRKDMMSLIARSDVIIIPVLPSPIDIHAAADFIRDLVVYGRIRTTQKPLAIVANRVKTNTAVYDLLKSFLASLRLPFVTSLRDSQNYIHASIHGIGIFEMDPLMVNRDIEQWQPLLRWINEAAEKGRMPLANHGRPRPRAVVHSRAGKPILRAVR